MMRIAKPKQCFGRVVSDDHAYRVWQRQDWARGRWYE